MARLSATSVHKPSQPLRSGGVFGRASAFIRRWPVLFLLPMALDLTQRVLEFSTGYYRRWGVLDPGVIPIWAILVVIKLLLVFLVVFTGCQWWAAQDDNHEFKPRYPRMLLGLAVLLLIYMGGALIAGAAFMLSGSALPTTFSKIAFGLGVTVLEWAWLSLTIPSAIGLAVEGSARSGRAALRNWRRQLGWASVVLLLAAAPWAASHLGLELAIYGQPQWLLICWMILADPLAMGLFAVFLGSGYYGLYRQAVQSTQSERTTEHSVAIG